MKDLRSPLAKVKGLGASGEDASHHFWAQRATALALIPLILWITFSIASLPEASYEAVASYLQHPFNAIVTTILVLVSLHHGHLGMEVIVEDYVHDHGIRLFTILFIKFLSYFLMVVGVYSIIKITLGG